jgi:ubiquinone/menaquinone biosynthesis C-methylase UbiE
MVMVGLEKRFMNSYFKKIMQQHFEFRIFKHFLAAHCIKLQNKVILEVGCGNGFGLKLISRAFQPVELVGIDIDQYQIQLAQQNCPQARVSVANVTEISEPSRKFDGIFAFTIFHHVPKWKKGLHEVHRLLKQNGVFLVNELNKKTLDWLERVIRVPHPPQARFTWNEFEKSLENAGFSILQRFQVLDAMGFFFCAKL